LTIIESEPGLTANLSPARAFTLVLAFPRRKAHCPACPRRAGGGSASIKRLAEEGFLVTPIRPPTVPVGTRPAALRLHCPVSRREIARLADAVRALVAFARAQESPSAVFITGTGTGVGKTLCAGLIRYFRGLENRAPS
jgi:8-amino-7-oxononanoate synthase